MSIFRVAIPDIERIWPLARMWIGKALVHSAERGLTAQQIHDGLLIGNYTLIIQQVGETITGAATLERYEESGRVICLIVTLAHEDINQENHRQFLDYVQGLALEYGCDCVQVKGRKGWERRLKGDGFEPIYTCLEKRVAA